MKTFNIILVFLLTTLFNVCFAQLNETKLVPSDGQIGDSFGYSVASDGNYMVVGSVYSDSLGLNSGSVYVYENVGGVWTENTKLLASDGTEGQEFGYSVSISGDFILIGAFRDDQNGTNAGAAYIFHKDSSGEWTDLQKLLPSDGSAYDEFGTSVSLHGEYAIIGAPLDHNNSVETGSAYIFKWNGSSWAEEAKLLASNGIGTSPKFGISVSIYGDYSIIGAYSDEGLGTHPGAAYIFHFDGINWIQQSKLNASDANLNHLFGHSVSIYEDYVVVGSSSALTAAGGAALIFHRDGTTWTEEAMVEGSSNSIHSDFGLSVSIDSDYLVVGAPDDDTNGNHAGCTYIFKRNGTNWIEQHVVLASDGTEDDKMGWSVFIEGDQVLSGAFGQYAGGQYCGAVYVYTGFVTDVNENESFPLEDFRLEQNYPNPFNPSTTIRWEMPESRKVTLIVNDILGREIATLVNEESSVGKHEINFNATYLNSGIYFYRLKAGDFIQTKKMLFIK